MTDAVIKLIRDEHLLPEDSLPSEGVLAQRLGVGVAPLPGRSVLLGVRVMY